MVLCFVVHVFSDVCCGDYSSAILLLSLCCGNYSSITSTILLLSLLSLHIHCALQPLLYYYCYYHYTIPYIHIYRYSSSHPLTLPYPISLPYSMGVICYVLLAGYPPFYDEDQKRLFKKIKEGRYHFHEDYWGNTSPEAINLIQMMLCVDQKKRWTASQLLQHPWITSGDDKLANKDLSSSITVMRKFNARRRLKSAADAVIMANRMKNMMATMGE